MRIRHILWLMVLMALAAGVSAAQAAPVGQFVQAEGEVDLAKGGQTPAVPVKPNDPVAVGDVVRTKSTGRAQIRFVDDSVLTIAPESKVAVEEYMFDPAKGARQATLEVFRGLVHATVEKVDPNKPADFFMKTHTAVMGVRGTKWFAKLLPTVTEVYTEGSLLEVRCLKFPDKMVLLKKLQFTQVGENFILPAVDITRETIQGLQLQLKSGAGTQSGRDRLGEYVDLLAMERLGRLLGQEYLIRNITSGFYVPPRPERVYSFLMEWSGSWSEYYSESPHLEGFQVFSYGAGSHSPFFPTSFSSEFAGRFQGPEDYSPLYGYFSAKATGTYRLIGGRYVGVMRVTYAISDYYGGGEGTAPKATLSGPFVFLPKHNLLTSTLSGPYQLYTGSRVTLRGVLRQQSHP